MLTEMARMGPIRRVNLTSQVMDSLKRYIVDNDIKAGGRLPTEKELVAELGVSRNILREALKSLEAVGLIEIRVGDGMYVCEFDYATVMNHISFAISRTKQQLKHFMHARIIVEVGALQHIMREIQDSDIDTLEEIHARFGKVTTMEQGAKIDLEFHQRLISISRNPVLAEFGGFLGRFFIEALYFLGVDRKASTNDAHAELIQALRDRDLPRAESIMRAHILTWERMLDFDPADFGM
jgi:GntR family transcriptional regulator, transcriptional repressor for pyruvate dehydrogenase complex